MRGNDRCKNVGAAAWRAPMDARQASPRGAASTNRYSCAVCLEAHAIEPVVTACGHLYCWQCLYRWLDAGHNRCPVCSARVDRNEVTPLYASDERDGELEKLRGRPASPVPRPRSRTPSPARRPGGYDSPGRGSPRRGTGSPTARDAPPLPFSTAARAEEDAFPSLFGLQFHRILWRSRGERDATDRWLALWKAVVLGGIVAMLLCC